MSSQPKLNLFGNNRNESISSKMNIHNKNTSQRYSYSEFMEACCQNLATSGAFALQKEEDLKTKLNRSMKSNSGDKKFAKMTSLRAIIQRECSLQSVF